MNSSQIKRHRYHALRDLFDKTRKGTTMNRYPLWHRVCRLTTVASIFTLLASLAAVAQTTTTQGNKVILPTKPVAKAAAASTAKPAASPATARPAAAKAAAQPAAAAAAGANQNAQPATGGVAPASALPVNSNYLGTAGNAMSSVPTAGTTAGAPRAPVAGQGVGTFLWPGGWTLTAYGCFRSGTRLFCDFDTTNQNNQQAGSYIWSGGGGVNLVDDGGKITYRHNAFFVGSDGSQFSTAYISPQPVRFIIEYDDVDQRYNAISLVLGSNRIQGVPITIVDPSQPAGTIPARASAGSPATGTPSAAQGANGAINKATNVLNNVSGQAQNVLKSVQGAVPSH